MTKQALIQESRQLFHNTLLDLVLKKDKENVPSNADKSSKVSVKIASGIIDKLGTAVQEKRLAGQRSGNRFEEICEEYIRSTFLKLNHLRPGIWEIGRGGGRLAIAQFEQYEHLAALERAARENTILAAALGSDYIIKPDIVIVRYPEDDKTINAQETIVTENEARRTSLRKINEGKPILHASISCKWTIRSDRAQNSRSEGLNLVRNRKGRLPHITVVTGEPMPSRIASIALGTGDIDCVYHFALPELIETVKELEMEDSLESLNIMLDGKRLRDISDLPLDLVV